MLAFLTSWLTPTSLFLFLNLIIGTIVLTHRFGSHKKQQQHHQVQEEGHQYYPPHHPVHQPISRASSLLERVRSINFSMYKWQEPEAETATTTTTTTITTSYLHGSEPEYTTPVDPPQRLERAPSLLERMKSIRLPSFSRSDPEPELQAEPVSDSGQHTDRGHASDHCVKRVKSEPRVAVSPEWKGTEKMKKSSSEKGVAVDNNEEEEVEVERRRPATTRLEKKVSFGDESVDAKADDFINRFKQQLKLQRLDSLLRYSEMLKGNKQKV